MILGCGHCKKAKPEFSAAAEEFKEDTRVQFAAVDCTTMGTVCQLHDVKGYPTFKYFQYLKSSKPYNGGRLKLDFVRFMSNPEHHSSDRKSSDGDGTGGFTWSEVEGNEHITFLEADTIRDAIKAKKSIFIMFYAPWCKHCAAMKNPFAKLAKELDKDGAEMPEIAAIDCNRHKGVTEKFNISGFPTCKLFVGGKEVTEYHGPKTVKDMKEFLKDNLKNSPNYRPSKDEF